MTVLLPVLIIQKIGFITIANYNSSRIKPSQNNTATDGMTEKKKTTQETKAQKITSWIQKTRVYLFYDAPIVKFLFYLVTYLAFVVIFSIFVLTDLHPLSEKTPSVFEYMTWLWTLSLAIEEIRQIAQPSKGSFQRNIVFWAKNVWNIFDMLMYLLFFVSVMARCLLISDEFYYARLAYAITLAMFIFRTMHFFFVARYLGPKVVMIGRLIGDLAFFFALFALFVFSFGIMYQAILFPNSLLSPWELFKDLIYLPYWQMYGELNLERIEGEEPSKCTSNPVLYANGTMPRCAQKSQFNSLILAIYLVLTNIVLVNLLIAMFSRTFEKVEDNAETIWKFNRYALVYEYYDRPMSQYLIVIHLTRIIVLCCYNLWTLPDDSPFESTFDDVERRKLHIVESRALLKIKGKQDASNTETDGKDKSANNQPDIDEVYEEIL
ncbi:TRPM3 [Mytilus edulis]|uniref:TRPM3 n=1 Tax=Mytilus edulis TaxID=6550 RepID=A0A8S3URH5_MYTED|nr:TRPM3 [Mytilus edulis]